MSLATIETATGKLFDILEPCFEDVDIKDIAHAGSQMNRFTGHCRYPYPVTQHERLGSYLIEDKTEAFYFLLHDGSESYITDMNRPMKYFTNAGEEYRKVEAPLQKLIYERYGLYGDEPKIVHEIDGQMLYAEKAQLLTGAAWPTKWSEDLKEAPVRIRRVSFDENKILYLQRFNELCRTEDRYEFTLWESVRLVWYQTKGRIINAIRRSTASHNQVR